MLDGDSIKKLSSGNRLLLEEYEMNIIGIIPARLGSSRFPGKPLAKICGIPMIGHIYLRSRMSKLFNNVYIATCDTEIEKYAKSINAKAIMTKNTHQRASDRCAEAMLKIESKTGKKIDIAVVIQGDEPMIRPEMIDLAVRLLLKDKSIFVSNLMARIKTQEEFNDSNIIKVVTDMHDFALYFSREPIPSSKKNKAAVPMLKQVCIIPFRRDFLIKFNELTPTPLEVSESVDMLRVLEHGYKIKMVLSPYNTYSVDTVEDLEKVEQLMSNDLFLDTYVHRGRDKNHKN